MTKLTRKSTGEEVELPDSERLTHERAQSLRKNIPHSRDMEEIAARREKYAGIDSSGKYIPRKTAEELQSEAADRFDARYSDLLRDPVARPRVFAEFINLQGKAALNGGADWDQELESMGERLRQQHYGPDYKPINSREVWIQERQRAAKAED